MRAYLSLQTSKLFGSCSFVPSFVLSMFVWQRSFSLRIYFCQCFVDFVSLKMQKIPAGSSCSVCVWVLKSKTSTSSMSLVFLVSFSTSYVPPTMRRALSLSCCPSLFCGEIWDNVDCTHGKGESKRHGHKGNQVIDKQIYRNCCAEY